MACSVYSKVIKLKLNTFVFLLAIWSISSFPQSTKEPNPVINSFNEFTKTPREIAYAHLNKSVYIKGETLAFSVYIFDKSEKKTSQLTTNLYCSISDDKGKTIKSKMLLVSNGEANGSFFVDSLFTSGNYTFKAYTNWMKNFDEQNFYIESIKVIDPEIESNIVPKVISSNLDAQFLPEGGHLLANAENTIGIVIKDSLGFGVPFVEGRLLNSKDEVINTFTVNQFGIGKFSFIPKADELYKAIIDFEGTQQVFNLDLVETLGIALSLNDLNDKIILRFATNRNTLKSIRDKPYKLTIHNGSEIKTVSIVFNDSLEITRLINYDDLFTGINIFTLFDEKNAPLLERLFFKYDGIQLIKTGELTFKKDKDSTVVSIPFKEIDTSYINKFSVSVLPEGTKSYSHHHNIISYLYLQPYIKGYIENAQYYFTDITRKKKYELDNLLLTQGWSSYDWNNVFNNPSKTDYNFENGIDFIAQVDETKTGKFILYPISNDGLEIFNVNDTIQTFEKNGLFPFDGETLKLSEIRKNRSAKKSEISAQFFPSKIPDLEKYIDILPLKEKVYFNSNTSQPLLETSWTDFEQLDEVIITVDKEQERIEKLKNSTFLGHVDVLNQTTRKAYLTFTDYIRTKGFRTIIDGKGKLTIYSNRGLYKVPARVYIDDVPLFNLDDDYRMDFIDYVVIDKSGYGEGLRGMGGVIKIYTDTNIAFEKNSSRSIYQEIEIPLTFTSPTKFYAPKYSFYSSRFYKEYGVIDWFPNLKVDETGAISFKIHPNQTNNFKIFIEGTTNNGALLSETKTIIFN